jgi:hypothetical protein
VPARLPAAGRGGGAALANGPNQLIDGHARQSIPASAADSVKPNEGTFVPPSPETLSARLYAAQRGGDAAFSIEQYQRAYNDAVRSIAASPLGSALRIEYIRQASEAGYYLAWGRLDQRNVDAADAIADQLAEWLRPYDKPTVPPELRLPLVRLLWLRSRMAGEREDSAEDDRLQARILGLIEDRKAYPEDYGAISRLAIAALWVWHPNPEGDARRKKACQIAAELDALVPGQMTIKLAECDNELARRNLAAKQLDAAQAALDRAKRRFAGAEAANASTPALRMILVDSHTIEASIAYEKKDPVGRARAQISAARLLSENLKGNAFFQNSPDQISSLYAALSDVSVDAIPEYAAEEKSARLQAELFGDLVASLEPTRRMFMKSRYLAAVAASAGGKAASALLKLGQPEKALDFSQRAVTAIEDADLPSQSTEFSEDGAAICQAYSRKVEALILLKRVDDAADAYTVFRNQCGAWLRKYPWDFYARQYVPSTASKLGFLLADSQRFAEARPLLEYASNWAFGDATKRLAELYRKGLGGSLDADRADRLEILAAGQGMKRFTIPTDFSGTRYPFYVYVQGFGAGTRCPADRALRPEEEDCVGFNGIDDQVQWVKQARRGMIPPDVVTAFQKLDRIARENNISFPELAVYALAAAQDANTGATEATAQAIFAEMHRTDFWRNPNRWLDPVGIALRGYDAVSYAQGDKPVAGRADTFALWDGAVWLFANADNRAAFLRDPERFAPQYGGFASMEMSEGNASVPSFDQFIRKNDRLYLFDSEDEKRRWAADSGVLAAKADANWLSSGANSTDRETPLGAMILKIGQVRRPTEAELARADLSRRSALVARTEQTGGTPSQLVSALGNRSWTYILLNRADEALADTDRALKINPSAAWVIGNRAEALLMKGRYDEALALFRSISTTSGPDQKKPMCEVILDDFAILRENKLVADAVLDRTARDIPCTRTASPGTG